ncbi:DinB family protein (plasmid) [Deinococcus sp. KNUC1210]|uniref:DinB family protein n=1 Tax=Deinococcus sp. KNUC1210 TaxID=2917691 RepID=UPI001EF06855|nr:DinB family protein [Deinococcus sp. KNUC1210]ULH14087.1 DinB family protein [Deinococcus sp. KNUC1210]
MNRLMQQRTHMIDLTHSLRDEVFKPISESDMEFSPGGSAHTLRGLMLEQADIQAAYAQSFRTLHLSFGDATPDEQQNIQELRAHFARLDAELLAALEALSDEDLKRPHDPRGLKAPGYTVETSFYTYRESVLIFAARATVYLRALGRDVPALMKSFVG